MIVGLVDLCSKRDYEGSSPNRDVVINNCLNYIPYSEATMAASPTLISAPPSLSLLLGD